MTWVCPGIKVAATAVLAVILVLWPRAGAGGVTAGVVAVDPAAIDVYVEQEMRAARIPGMAVGIVQGDRYSDPLRLAKVNEEKMLWKRNNSGWQGKWRL
jgi:hypothetical protein